MIALHFRIQEPDLAPRSAKIDEGMIIGRHAENDCVLNDPQVSGRHAKIVSLAEGLAIEDLGSTNNTHVDGGPILAHGDCVLLAEGMRFLIGGTRLEVISEADLSNSGQLLAQTMVSDEHPGPRARSGRASDETWDANLEPPVAAKEPETWDAASPPPEAQAPTAEDAATLDAFEESQDQRDEIKVIRRNVQDQRGDGEAVPGVKEVSEKSRAVAEQVIAKLQDESAAGQVTSPAIGMDETLDAEYLRWAPRFIVVEEGRRETVPLLLRQVGSDVEAHLGRSSQCAVNLRDTSASGDHARILFAEGRFAVEDLGSTNGSFVGVETLAPNQPFPLAANYTLRCANAQLLFVTDLDEKGQRFSEDRYEKALENLERQLLISTPDARSLLSDYLEKGEHPGEALVAAGRVQPQQWSAAFYNNAHPFGSARPAGGSTFWLWFCVSLVVVATMAFAAWKYFS